MKKKDQQLGGVVAASLVICIWSTWLVVSRAGSQSELTIFDLAALRYGVSGIITIPLICYFKPWKKLAIYKMVIIMICLGPLYVFCVFGGFLYAPVAHGGVFLNGSLPVLTLFIGIFFLSKKVSYTQFVGLILIVFASILFLRDSDATVTLNTLKGDILFFISAIFFSGYLVLARRWNISMMEVVFCSSTLNCLVYLPIWFLFIPKGNFDASSAHFFLQMFYQGFMPNVVGLLLVAYAAKNIGAAATAAFLAGVPPLSTLLGFFFLNENLGFLGWVSVVIIVPGIILAAINKKVGQLF